MTALMSGSDLETDCAFVEAPTLPPRDFPRTLKSEPKEPYFGLKDSEDNEPPLIPERSYKAVLNGVSQEEAISPVANKSNSSTDEDLIKRLQNLDLKHADNEPPLIPERTYNTVLKEPASPPSPVRSSDGTFREKVISPVENVTDGRQKLILQGRGIVSGVCESKPPDQCDGLARPPQNIQFCRYKPYQVHSQPIKCRKSNTPTSFQDSVFEEFHRNIINGCIDRLDNSIIEDSENVRREIITDYLGEYPYVAPFVPPRRPNISSQQLPLTNGFNKPSPNCINVPSPQVVLGSTPPYPRTIVHQQPILHHRSPPTAPNIFLQSAISYPNNLSPHSGNFAEIGMANVPNLPFTERISPDQVTMTTANLPFIDQISVNNKHSMSDFSLGLSQNQIANQIHSRYSPTDDVLAFQNQVQVSKPMTNFTAAQPCFWDTSPVFTSPVNALPVPDGRVNTGKSYLNSSSPQSSRIGQIGVQSIQILDADNTFSSRREVLPDIDQMPPPPCISNSSQEAYIHCIFQNDITKAAMTTSNNLSHGSPLTTHYNLTPGLPLQYSVAQQSPPSPHNLSHGSPLQYTVAQRSPPSPHNLSQRSPLTHNNLLQQITTEKTVCVPPGIPIKYDTIPGDIFDIPISCLANSAWNVQLSTQNNLSVSTNHNNLNSSNTRTSNAEHNLSLNIEEPGDISVNKNMDNTQVIKANPNVIDVEEDETEEMSWDEAKGLSPCLHREWILHSLAASHDHKLLDRSIQWIGSNRESIINSINKLSQTPLFIAVQVNDTLMVRKLIGYGANANIQGKVCEDGELRSPLHVAAALGEQALEMVDLLLSCEDIDIDALSITDHVTPLHVAIESHKEGVVNCFPTVEMLVDNGADVEMPIESSSKTPLMQIIEKQNLQLIKNFLQLIENTCTYISKRRRILNATTRSGDSSLHVAAGLTKLHSPNKVTLLRLLVRHGADSSLLNNAKEKPSDFAAQEWREAFQNG